MQFLSKNNSNYLEIKVEMLLTLILLTWSIWRAPNNVSKWKMGFNSAFKGLLNNSVLASVKSVEFLRKI